MKEREFKNVSLSHDGPLGDDLAERAIALYFAHPHPKPFSIAIRESDSWADACPITEPLPKSIALWVTDSLTDADTDTRTVTYTYATAYPNPMRPNY